MTVRKIGLSTVTSKDNSAKIIAKMLRARIVATQAMAEEAKRLGEVIYNNDGDGTWKANAPSTIEWKGHEKVMLGRTGTLSDNIEIRPGSTPSYLAVGWFENDHPDSNLSRAGLAWIHEMDRPWLSKVHDNPQHANAVYAVGRAAYLAVL